MKCYPKNQGKNTVHRLFSLLGFDTMSQSNVDLTISIQHIQIMLA